MSKSVFFYQVALVGSIWYFTLNYGWLGYMLTMIFWSAFTFFRAQTFKLKILQTTVLFASGYIMWEEAYADLLKTAESAGVWLLAGSGVIAIVFLVLVFRWLSAVVYANMSKRIGDAESFLANPRLGVVKEAVKNSALSACGISDVLDTREPVYLNVPYHEKEEAKTLGARWDAEKKTWYVPGNVSTAPFARWTENKPTPGPTPANAHGGTLFIDLVPNSAWFSNLRSELTEEEWGAVKKATFSASGYLCEVCGGRGPKHPVECHERWHYDSSTKIQTLIRTIALCPACHETTHFGLARVKGRDQEARRHLMQVNGWDDAQAAEHIRIAMDEWKRRSELKWKLDARWLLDFVPLSGDTKKKIKGHAAGLAERTVQNWQKDVIADAAKTSKEERTHHAL